jgi:hypothetical protein
MQEDRKNHPQPPQPPKHPEPVRKDGGKSIGDSVPTRVQPTQEWPRPEKKGK